MTTRNVTATILKTNGTALVGGTVKFIIDNNKTGVTVSPADLYPPTELEFTTDANGRLNGATGVALWANAEGLTRTHYRCTLPSGNTFPFTLPAGGTVIDLADLRIAGTTLVDLGDPIIAVIDARIALVPSGGAWGSITGTLSAQTDLQTALNLLAPKASPTFTGTVVGVTAAMVGLGSVDNTSDANKPVSTAQQTALNLKANLISPSFTTPTLGAAGATSLAVATITETGQYINSLNGALSTPSMLISGTPITGGSGTTTHPLFYLNSGAAPSTWSTAGTIVGLNAPSGFTGNFIDLHLNGGTSAFSISSAGSVNAGGSIIATNAVKAGGTSFFEWNGRGAMFSPADSQIRLLNNASTGFQSLILGSAAPSTIGAAPTHAQGISILQAEELLTIAAAATTTTTMQVPAGAIVLSVNVRVTTVIPTAANFSVKIGATTFSTTAVLVAAGTTDDGTAAGAFYNATAGGVIITPNLTPGAATGVVRVTVSYLKITSATS